MASINLSEGETFALINDLISKRLVGWDGDTLVFLTRRCATVFTPRDGLIAHDLDERLSEWMAQPERWNTLHLRRQLEPRSR
jgi:hypothetical protein